MGMHASQAQFRTRAFTVGTAPIPPGSEDAPVALQAIGTLAQFKRNQSVFGEGDAAQSVFKIVSGAVRLCKLLPDGRRQIAGFRLAGDFFGLESDGEYTLTAEALCDLVTIRYGRAHLARLEDDKSDVRKHLTTLLRRDLQAAQGQLIMLGRQSAQERVASFILQLADRADASNGCTVAIPMGRQDIADYLGLTIETVCRAISDLKRRRIVAVPDRGSIRILNLDALEADAEGAVD